MEKKYIFRADGNTHIGVGHIMRCLTIADALADKAGREKLLFVCADEDSAKVARDRGYDVQILNTDYTKMDDELDNWTEIGSGKTIIVDSYYVTDSYLQSLQTYGRVMLMDDMQEHAYPVDAVINYNIFADPDKYHELYGDISRCYLGCGYAPIRPQFVGVTYNPKPVVTDLLITTGGADSFNIAGRVYKALRENKTGKGLHYHIVSGIYSPFYEELKQYENENGDLTVYHNVTDMASLMKKCDVAITAAGSTIYELAAIGVPILCLTYADNQIPGAKYVGENIAYYAGAFDREPEQTLKNILDAFTEKYCDMTYRMQCMEKEKQLVDGQGPARIAEVIISK